MKILCLLFFFGSFSAHAGRVLCEAQDYIFTIDSASPQDVKVTFRGETVLADGIVTSGEVDLVARFSSIGEMTLFAKLGKVSPENYAFIQGRRFSVLCR